MKREVGAGVLQVQSGFRLADRPMGSNIVGSDSAESNIRIGSRNGCRRTNWSGRQVVMLYDGHGGRLGGNGQTDLDHFTGVGRSFTELRLGMDWKCIWTGHLRRIEGHSEMNSIET